MKLDLGGYNNYDKKTVLQCFNIFLTEKSMLAHNFKPGYQIESVSNYLYRKINILLSSFSD